jgi:hypothetical protein
MLGPTLVAGTIVLDHVVARPSWRRTRWVALVALLLASSWFALSGRHVLRPNLFWNQGRQAASAAVRGLGKRSLVLVDDWSARAYLREMAPDRFAYVGMGWGPARARLAEADEVVVLLVDDNGRKFGIAGWISERLREAGFSPGDVETWVGPYDDDAATLARLGLVADEAQYTLVGYYRR